MTVGTFLQQTTTLFTQANIQTARLDTLILLSDVFKKDKSWILAHPEATIPADLLITLENNVVQRQKRIPLAYIRGHQQFYGRNFGVTPDVLIPRPETEELIDQLKKLDLPTNATLLDVGTGSGAIAITAALELPGLVVDASDVSSTALKIAGQNAQKLQAPIRSFFVSDLLSPAGTYNVITANLPYVSNSWQRSPETSYEPALALFANNEGLELIQKLLIQAPAHLTPGGYIVLEADPRQFGAIVTNLPPGLKCGAKQDFALVLHYTQ